MRADISSGDWDIVRMTSLLMVFEDDYHDVVKMLKEPEITEFNHLLIITHKMPNMRPEHEA
jgi:hypothetical protein